MCNLWVRTAALAAALACGACQSGGSRSVSTPDLMRRSHLDYGEVLVFTDVTYANIVGFRPLKMSIYMPKRDAVPHPWVVFVHGGGWRVDPEGTEGASGTAAVLQLCRSGYVVFVPAYRTSGEAKFPAQLLDVKAAIRYAKTHAVAYHAAPERVAIWGASAGGNLAALVATTCGVASLEPEAAVQAAPGGPRIPYIDPAVDSCVRTAVDWFGPTDFSTMDAEAAADGQAGKVHGLPGSPESLYLGCVLTDCSSERLQAANPSAYAGSRSAPTLIMHGLADRRVPWQQSQHFYDALQARGVESRLVLVPNADHEFGGLSDQQRREQVDIVIEWIGAHIKS